ncbi:MAG: carboxyl transferase domain-containing protein, partial [Actinomycetota bacterium]
MTEAKEVETALYDEGSFRPVDGPTSQDPLAYPGYLDDLGAAGERAGTDESVVAGPARVGGYDVELAQFVFPFMGGSMGEASGERLALALERAADRKVPMVLRTETGGARMQEGMRSLVQMPKILAVRRALSAAAQPLIAILGNPTTGGVLASIAADADVAVAEAGATVGFAGPRVVARATGSPPPADSHTARAAFDNGLVDMVVASDGIRDYVARALRTLAPDTPDPVEPPDSLSKDEAKRDAAEAVKTLRSSPPPRAPHLTVAMSDSSIQLRGDRAGTQDPALVTSLERVAGRRALVMALDSKFAPGPGAYRKARRCLAIAQRLQIPVVTIVDTEGADPSPRSEAGGIAWEISSLTQDMLGAEVPTLAIVTGHGGSGGALAFAATDVLLAYEGAVFSVIAVDLAAEILWRDASRSAEAARLLDPTARRLVELGIADGLLAEPVSAESLRRAVAYHLDVLSKRPV